MIRPIAARCLTLLTLLVCGSLVSCSARVIHHSTDDAAASATKFAERAFVQKDYTGAREFISPQFTHVDTDDKLAAAVEALHPKSRPSEVTATEFEPIPGQRAMQIYLKGKQGDEQFFYRMLLLGDQPSGYKVGGIWRGNGPYPPSARRPLTPDH
jgi:hypothetical protein